MEVDILNFYHEIPKTTIDAIKAIHVDSNNTLSNSGASTLVGICLAPLPRSGTDSTTTGFRIVIVGHKPDDSLLMYSSSELSAMNSDAATAAGAPPEGGAEGAPASTQVVFDPNIFLTSVSSQPVMAPLDRLFYNGTTEFEFAFIDIHILDYFLESNVFYLPGTTVGTWTDNNSQPVANRGIRIERALVQFNRPLTALLTGSSAQNLNTYRTLKVQPAPEPVLLSNQTRMAAMAYYIIPTCPPFWRAQNTVNLNESLRVARATIAPIQANGENKECVAPVFRISQEDLRNQLVEKGYIDRKSVV